MYIHFSYKEIFISFVKINLNIRIILLPLLYISLLFFCDLNKEVHIFSHLVLLFLLFQKKKNIYIYIYIYKSQWQTDYYPMSSGLWLLPQVKPTGLRLVLDLGWILQSEKVTIASGFKKPGANPETQKHGLFQSKGIVPLFGSLSHTLTHTLLTLTSQRQKNFLCSRSSTSRRRSEELGKP